MDLLTREVLNQTIAEAIDATRNKICAEDEIFQQDEKDLDELTKRVMDLDLPEHDRMIINDYIACLQTVDCRYADISYMAGIEDAITSLKKILNFQKFFHSNVKIGAYLLQHSNLHYFTPVFVSKISIRNGNIASCSLTYD